LHSVALLSLGTTGIGFGNGLFAVCTLTAAMALGEEGGSGLALGVWGSVQATAAALWEDVAQIVAPEPSPGDRSREEIMENPRYYELRNSALDFLYNRFAHDDDEA
jgi:hypothetical protein